MADDSAVVAAYAKPMEDIELGNITQPILAPDNDDLPAAGEPVLLQDNSAGELPAAVAKSEYGPPELTYLQLFTLFLSFGIRAFGGPVAQIAMIKQQLVVDGRWIPIDKFHRVLAVYQVLPGPEATELACYFGLLAKGRLGSVIGGLAFILPGCTMTVILSWVYYTWGLEEVHVRACFRALSPCVTAMIFRALHKLGEHSFMIEEGGKQVFSMYLGFLGVYAFLLTSLYALCQKRREANELTRRDR